MTGLYVAAAVMALLSGTRALERLYRERSQIVAASALSMVASGAALILVAFNPALLKVSPAGAVVTWVSASLGLVGAWAFLYTLAAVRGEKTRTAVHVVIPPAGAILVVLVQAVLHASRVAHGLPATTAGLVLLAFCCPAVGGIAALAWRCSRHIPVRHIESGMRAVAAAAVVELLLILARGAEIILAVGRGSAETPEMTAIDLAQGLAVIQLIAGATITAWFPVAVVASRQCCMWAAWWRLRPLWALLLKAAPDVQLPAQQGTRLRASYRLHRRVIEIRDAELALRPFRDSQAALEAADAARSAGLPRDELDAVIEAVMIVIALGALRGGAETLGCPHSAHAIPEPGNDLESEAERLLLVSRAVRRSPIVHQIARAARNRLTSDRVPL